MTGKRGDAPARRGIRRSLNGKILSNTTFNILILVIVSSVIMALSMQSLANNILLDSLQPMARQAAKTVEANIHMLADRMMTIALDPRMTGEGQSSGLESAAVEASRREVLEESAEIYEVYAIALYDLDGRLVQGIDGAPESLEGDFLALLKETDNLTTDPSTIYQDKLGIRMGMPVKGEEGTVLYVVGIYKYDLLNDVISSINLGKSGMAYMVNREGIVTGHPDQSLALGGSTLGTVNK